MAAEDLRCACVGNLNARSQGRVAGGFEGHVRRVLIESLAGTRELGFLPERLETGVLNVRHLDLERI
jgi:hypothetical protein